MAATQVAAKDNAGPSRPAARPNTQASRHHLEPNPFEQSFSSKPGRSESPEMSRYGRENNKKGGHKPTKSESGVEDNNEDRNGLTNDGNKKGMNEGPVTPNGQSGSSSKRILPPVASIASPAGQENAMPYPWSSSLTGSLRAGPLSPAMLAGPQQSFDPTSFRTGLTPDLSSFKTGLTPLGGASGSFPPPSPNTAAFLAMVTNNGASGLSGATITPNTLSALNGNPMDMQNANGGQILAVQPENSSGNENDTQAKVEAGQHGEGSYGKQQQQQQNHYQQNIRGSNNVKRQNGQGSDNGLFLLSQAQQELAKRDDGGVDMSNVQSLYDNVPIRQNGFHGSPVQNPKNGKRKNGAEGKPSSGKKSKGHKDESGSPSPESDELIDESKHNFQSGSSNHDSNADDFGADDDEKRKNFLERNRQAALKCRQRKKAWLASLQAKVEYLQADNDNLQGTLAALRNEVMFLKSQLMHAQRQMSNHGMPNGGGPPVNTSQPGGGANDPMVRHISAPMGMPNGMIPTGMTQVPHSNIHAMAAAAAAATSNVNMLANGQYQAHPVPRPTHIPGHSGPQYGNSKAPRQSSIHV